MLSLNRFFRFELNCVGRVKPCNRVELVVEAVAARVTNAKLLPTGTWHEIDLNLMRDLVIAWTPLIAQDMY